MPMHEMERERENRDTRKHGADVETGYVDAGMLMQRKTMNLYPASR